jgi:pimeloyl-ACP methyl ester carboxylesterase
MSALFDEIALQDPRAEVDFLEAGSSGSVVMLVHASAAGARQWRRLMDVLKEQFRVRAVNLFGYGKTPDWPAHRPQSLDDQARLVEATIPADADAIVLVGHSFGASVAMKTAARLKGRVARLVLLEPIPFSLLAQNGHSEAFAEAEALSHWVKHFGARGEWEKAAERFADYWIGDGSWRNMPPPRRAQFANALKPNRFEWDAVLHEPTTAGEWASLLPRETLMICDPATVRPVREIAAILRQACPEWAHREIPGAGHMAPLTHPDLVNPIVSAYLAPLVRMAEHCG